MFIIFCTTQYHNNTFLSYLTKLLLPFYNIQYTHSGKGSNTEVENFQAQLEGLTTIVADMSEKMAKLEKEIKIMKVSPLNAA